MGAENEFGGTPLPVKRGRIVATSQREDTEAEAAAAVDPGSESDFGSADALRRRQAAVSRRRRYPGPTFEKTGAPSTPALRKSADVPPTLPAAADDSYADATEGAVTTMQEAVATADIAYDEAKKLVTKTRERQQRLEDFFAAKADEAAKGDATGAEGAADDVPAAQAEDTR